MTKNRSIGIHEMQSEPKILQSKKKLIIILGIASCLLLFAFYFFLPVGHEYSVLFRPAALRIINGGSPYDMEYYNPPWILIILLPFALLPERVGFAVFTLCGLMAFAYISIRCKVKTWYVIAVLFSFPVAYCLYRGEIDWIALLGVTLPPQYGLLLVLSKPQIGIGIAIYWIFDAFRTGGVKKLTALIAPTSLIYLASTFLFGLWFIPPASMLTHPFNTSLWPESIPIGLAFLVFAMRKSSSNFSILASPFLSPYLIPNSWSGVLLALSPYPAELIAVSVGTWIWRFFVVFK